MPLPTESARPISPLLSALTLGALESVPLSLELEQPTAPAQAAVAANAKTETLLKILRTETSENALTRAKCAPNPARRARPQYKSRANAAAPPSHCASLRSPANPARFCVTLGALLGARSAQLRKS